MTTTRLCLAAMAATTLQASLALADGTPGGSPMSAEVPDRMMPRQPDYGAVTKRELDGAVAEGTRAALIRFIARHADDPLASQAYGILDARPNMPGSDTGSTDPDATIYRAFDSAYRANTAAAYDTFIARFAPHPLAIEAARLRAAASPKPR